MPGRLLVTGRNDTLVKVEAYLNTVRDGLGLKHRVRMERQNNSHDRAANWANHNQTSLSEADSHADFGALVDLIQESIGSEMELSNENNQFDGSLSLVLSATDQVYENVNSSNHELRNILTATTAVFAVEDILKAMGDS